MLARHERSDTREASSSSPGWLPVPIFGLLILVLGCAEAATETRQDGVTARATPTLATSGPSAWFETQKLVIEPSAPDQRLGEHLVISGTTALVTRGCCRVFVLAAAQGVFSVDHELVLDDPGPTGEQVSLAIAGDTALVGLPGTVFDVRGVARVFSRVGSVWTSEALLVADDETSYAAFGAAVATDGVTAVVGAPFEQAAYVFARTASGWARRARLVPGDPSGLRDSFGSAVAVSGTRVVVGMPADDETQERSPHGAVYIYTAPSDPAEAWTEEKLLAPNIRSGFGAAVAIDGEDVLVGSPFQAAAAYAFSKNGSTWTSQELTSGAEVPSPGFGSSVALSASRAVIGDPGFQAEPRFFPGATYVFEKRGTAWNRLQELLGSDAATNARFGAAVGVAGDAIVVGAPGLDGTTTEGAVYVERYLGDAGSACRESANCGLGHCVSGVCCERACSGACEECSTGACLPLAPGSTGDPSCGPYRCDGARRTCPERCLSEDDCVDTHYCSDGECKRKGRLDEPCSGPEQCASGHCLGMRCSGTQPEGAACERASDCERGYCVDGVCCNDACGGQCEACDVAGSEGRCSPVNGTPHGEREPCAGEGTTCGGNCDGKITDRCAYPTGTTECGSSCANNRETVSACDGQGECVSGEPRLCGAFTCSEDGVECRSSCSADRDCAEGLSCWENGECEPNFRCASDHESEAAPGGVLRDCRPYLCGSRTGGECPTRCTSSSDCVEPAACDSSQRCVLRSEDVGGCGCRTIRASNHAVSGAGIVLALLALARRRASSRRSSS